MATMETLGIQLPPPGFRQHDPTPNQLPWRHETTPHMQMIFPATTHPMVTQSYERPNRVTGDDRLLERMDELVEVNSQYNFPYQGEQYPIMPHMMTSFPGLNPESLYSVDHNSIAHDHQYSSPTSAIGQPLTAEEYIIPFHNTSDYGSLGDFPVTDCGPSMPQQAPFDISNEFRRFQRSQTHQHNNRGLATRGSNNQHPTGSYLSKPTNELRKTAGGRVQKLSSQSHNRSSILSFPPSSNELLATLINVPTTTTIAPNPGIPQYPQQYHHLIPPPLLPSNVDSSGMPMKTTHPSIRRTAERQLGNNIISNIDVIGATSTIKRLYTSNISRPPDLLGPLLEEQLPPPAKDMTPDDPEMMPHKQKLRFDDDLYTPIWVRGHGNKREGWCGICKPGRWLVLKNSAFWYDKSFSHGVSAVTGQAFDAPKEVRKVRRMKETDGHRTTTWEGLCGNCSDWIPLVSSKKKGTTWFRHAYKCQNQSQSQLKNKDRDGTKESTISSSSSLSLSSSLSVASVYDRRCKESIESDKISNGRQAVTP